jgi:transposase
MTKQAREKYVKLPATRRAGLTAGEFARLLGVSKLTARRWASELGYRLKDLPRFGLGRPTKEAAAERVQLFQELTPGLTAGQLARRLGVSILTARKWAAQFDYHLPSSRLGSPRGWRKPPEKRAAHNPPWVNVDWSLMDVEIARRLGVSRERVRQVRRDLGLPPSRGK